MANYVLLYHGGGTPETDDERARVLQAWGEWFDRVGAAMVDGGNPFGNSRALRADGVADGTGDDPATGYSIVKADSLDDATELAKGCPILDDPGGRIEVYETFQAM
jgi:hypothetical protein